MRIPWTARRSNQSILKEISPWWLSGKEFTCQCRSHEFDPWVERIPWKKKQQPTPEFLPEKSYGQRSLAGYSPWGSQKSDTTEQLNNNTGQMRLLRLQKRHALPWVTRLINGSDGSKTPKLLTFNLVGFSRPFVQVLNQFLIGS